MSLIQLKKQLVNKLKLVGKVNNSERKFEEMH